MDSETLDWVRRCSRECRKAGMYPETAIWDAIAERGDEYKLAPLPEGVSMMPARECFRNAVLTALGATEWDDDTLRYAEGFVYRDDIGMWLHHAWVVTDAGVAVDRTWHLPGSRYVGVIVPIDETSPNLGGSTFARHPIGIAWGPYFAAIPTDVLDIFFGPNDPV